MFNQLWNGGSRLINTGNAVNDYTFICSGDQLTLGINGTEVKTISTKSGQYPQLSDGQVGVSVGSNTPVPVIVEFDDFIISVP